MNAIADYCFLRQECNLSVSDREPQAYLKEVTARYPGALESQWVPMDRNLWRVERYRDFLAARPELLAQAANQFVNELLSGTAPREEIGPAGVTSSEEERTLLDCVD